MNVLGLRSSRVKKGLTQGDIAKKLFITTKTYNRKELGITHFSPEEIKNISIILELTIDEVNQIFFDNKLTNRLICEGG